MPIEVATEVLSPQADDASGRIAGDDIRGRIDGSGQNSALLNFETSFARTLLRSMRWLVEGLRFLMVMLWDRARGRRDARSQGRRLRQMFERMGGTAVKVGQQLSVRIDLLSYEICDELSQLLDRMPAFDVSYAIERVEHTIGKPLEEVFDAFDPEPIGAASIACVYQARLKTGEHVAVKVRRPLVARQFATDLRFLDWFTQVPELLALVKPGFFEHLRMELRLMLLEELDFEREARYQRLFRQAARKAHIDWLTAPQVYTEYCGPDVMVSEYVTGVWCRDLLAAQESQDHEFLAYAKTHNIAPKLVARRLLHTQFWSCYEALFFHADPHPSNVIIQAGSKMVFLDFGACGTTSRAVQRNQQALLDRMVRNDVGGMADVALQLLAPLPRVDEYEFKKRIEDAYHRVIYALRDKDSAWWERTTMSLWLTMVKVTREFKLPINIDVMRQFRSSLLYDTLAFRLDGQLDLPREYKRYRREAAHRAWRTMRRQIEKVTPRQVRHGSLQGLDRAADSVTQTSWRAETTAEKLSLSLQAAINKGSYFAITAMRFVAQAAVVIGVIAVLRIGWQIVRSEPITPVWTLLSRDVLLHPLVLTVVGGLLLLNVRRALLRLGEPDDQGERIRKPWA